MQALRIVDSGRDALGFQPFHDLLPAGNPDRVLGVDMGIPGSNPRSGADVLQELRVARPYPAPGLNLPGKMLQFRDQNSRLQGIKPAVHAQKRVMMALLAPMGADRLHRSGQGVVIREERPAIPVTSQRLGREKTGAADGAGGAAFPSVPGGAKALGCVLQNGNAVLGGQPVDPFDIG